MNISITQHSQQSSPIWLKIISAVGVIWYAFGLMQFGLAYSMDTVSAVAAGDMTSAHGAAVDATPLIIWIAFAVASGAGLIGAVLLFVHSSRAKLAFGISLVSAIIYYAWVYGISGTGSVRPSEEAIIAAVVVGVTALFFLFSRRIN